MNRRTSRILWLLFALLSIVAFGGPFAIWLAILGGERTDWPPDRPIEWWMVLGILGLFAALLIACVGTAAANLRGKRDSDQARAGLDLGSSEVLHGKDRQRS